MTHMMTPIELFIYCLASISATHIVTGSSIFAPIRAFFVKHSDKKKIANFFNEMLMCNTCSGFWVGIVTYFLWAIAEHQSLGWRSLIFGFMFGLLTSLGADLVYRLKSYLCEACG